MKIDYKVVGNLIACIVTGLYLIKMFYIIVVYPFVVKSTTTLTETGVLLTFLAGYIFIVTLSSIIDKIKRLWSYTYH